MPRISVENKHFNKEENMKTKMVDVLAVIVVGLAFIVCPAFAAEQRNPTSSSSGAMTSASPISAPTRRA